jgi:hypothetical protein
LINHWIGCVIKTLMKVIREVITDLRNFYMVRGQQRGGGGRPKDWTQWTDPGLPLVRLGSTTTWPRKGALSLVKLEDHNKAGPDPKVYSTHRAP